MLNKNNKAIVKKEYVDPNNKFKYEYTGYFNDDGDYVLHSVDDEYSEILNFNNIDGLSGVEYKKHKDGKVFYNFRESVKEEDSTTFSEESFFDENQNLHRDDNYSHLVRFDNGTVLTEYYKNGKPDYSITGVSSELRDKDNILLNYDNEDISYFTTNQSKFISGKLYDVKEILYKNGVIDDYNLQSFTEDESNKIDNLFNLIGVKLNHNSIFREIYNNDLSAYSVTFLNQGKGYELESIAVENNVKSVVINVNNSYKILFTFINDELIRISNKVDKVFTNFKGLKFNLLIQEGAVILERYLQKLKKKYIIVPDEKNSIIHIIKKLFQGEIKLAEASKYMSILYDKNEQVIEAYISDNNVVKVKSDVSYIHYNNHKYSNKEYILAIKDSNLNFSIEVKDGNTEV